MNKKISETLDMVPLEEIDNNEVIEYEPKKKSKQERTEIENDFEFARENIYEIISEGGSALIELMDVARQSQHPRAYEVLATTMKTILDANKDLVEIAEKKEAHRKEKEEPKEKEGNTINNTLVFQGTTSELQDMLEEIRNKNDNKDN